ncbi:MAG: hypothetical protein DWQ07_06830 [Chloroflexi bacterium]|nr:MAG: hypothetical protein DWQ07_06830 [Chloroflexota bacterium]
MILTLLILAGCASPPPAEEQPVELPTPETVVSTPVEIEPEVVELGSDCGAELSPEECANSGDHVYLQFVEAENICNDDSNDEIVQFLLSFSDGEVLVSDIGNGESRTYTNIDTNLYRHEKTFENGWVDTYVIEFTPAGFTEIYDYLDPDQGETLACHRITRTLSDSE